MQTTPPINPYYHDLSTPKLLAYYNVISSYTGIHNHIQEVEKEIETRNN